MKKKQTKRYIIKRFQIYYTALFIIFGILIALLSSAVDYRLKLTNVEKQLIREAAAELIQKQEELASFTLGLEEYIDALRQSKPLNSYILNSTSKNRERILHVMYTLAASDPIVMQLRYLDQTGMERLRVDRKFASEQPEIIAEEKLQDKSQRYYFIETARLPPEQFWNSRLDLNIENREIEFPYKPVLRIATPVYIDQEFRGIVILNIFAKEFLSRFSKSSLFHISLIDRDGYFIMDHIQERSWSRYLQSGYQVQDTFPELAMRIQGGEVQPEIERFGTIFAASVARQLPQDQATIIFTPKKEALKSMKAERQNSAGLIILIILLFSLPLSFLISLVPARLNQKLSRQNAILTEYFDLIDTNIISCTTDLAGNFMEISSAFAAICGYPKEELLGKNYSMLQTDEEGKEHFRKIWRIVASGKVWHGEISHTDRSNKTYWTEATIYPKRDRLGRITECSAIHQDISNRKRMEQLSITDDLTGLYNRRFFNETITRELNRAQRDGKLLSFAMFDVDYFKQYNDHYGHLKGDEVLRAIGQTLRNKLGRGSDSCFRLGGEEFGVIFVDLSPQEALSFVEDIRIAVKNIGIEHRWNVVCDVVTISAGLLSVTPGPGITTDSVYKKTDEALYQAKALGRNQVVPSLLNTRI